MAKSLGDRIVEGIGREILAETAMFLGLVLGSQGEFVEEIDEPIRKKKRVRQLPPVIDAKERKKIEKHARMMERRTDKPVVRDLATGKYLDAEWVD